MPEKNIQPKNQELVNCTYGGKGYCAAVGCLARTLLINLRDAKGQPDTPERAEKIITESRNMGCQTNPAFS